jgi:hypothetical protein
MAEPALLPDTPNEKRRLKTTAVRKYCSTQEYRFTLDLE